MSIEVNEDQLIIFRSFLGKERIEKAEAILKKIGSQSLASSQLNDIEIQLLAIIIAQIIERASNKINVEQLSHPAMSSLLRINLPVFIEQLENKGIFGRDSLGQYIYLIGINSSKLESRTLSNENKDDLFDDDSVNTDELESLSTDSTTSTTASDRFFNSSSHEAKPSSQPESKGLEVDAEMADSTLSRRNYRQDESKYRYASSIHHQIRYLELLKKCETEILHYQQQNADIKNRMGEKIKRINTLAKNLSALQSLLSEQGLLISHLMLQVTGEKKNLKILEKNYTRRHNYKSCAEEYEYMQCVFKWDNANLTNTPFSIPELDTIISRELSRLHLLTQNHEQRLSANNERIQNLQNLVKVDKSIYNSINLVLEPVTNNRACPDPCQSSTTRPSSPLSFLAPSGSPLQRYSIYREPLTRGAYKHRRDKESDPSPRKNKSCRLN